MAAPAAAIPQESTPQLSGDDVKDETKIAMASTAANPGKTDAATRTIRLSGHTVRRPSIRAKSSAKAATTRIGKMIEVSIGTIPIPYLTRNTAGRPGIQQRWTTRFSIA